MAAPAFVRLKHHITPTAESQSNAYIALRFAYCGLICCQRPRMKEPDFVSICNPNELSQHQFRHGATICAHPVH
jgi:hypothetical protein